MNRIRLLAITAASVIVASCHSAPSATPAAAPSPGSGRASGPPVTPPAAPPAATPPAAAPPAVAAPGAGPARGAGPGGAARPPALSPDSVAKLRQGAIDQLTASIAGHENEPAEQVFKNIQVLKGKTAGQLLNIMNNTYGKGLSARCSSCHNPGNWASDSMPNKGRARIMQIMVDDINTNHISKLTRNPQVNCMTCHHGLSQPNQSLDAKLPQPAPAAGGRGGGR